MDQVQVKTEPVEDLETSGESYETANINRKWGGVVVMSE